MKFTTEAQVTVPENTGGSKFRTIKPDTYVAIVRKLESGGYQGRVYDREAKGYVNNGEKFQYATLTPDLQIIVPDSAPIEISRESFVVGVIEKGKLISPAHKYGKLDDPNPIWFGFGGAGYLMTAIGMLNEEGVLQDIETESIADVVIKVRTDIGAFIPNPVGKSFKPDDLKAILKSVNGGKEYSFEDVDHLVLRYNLLNNYTRVDDSAKKTLYDESNADEVTREVYASLIEGYRNNEIVFMDIHDDSDEDNSVRLKTKTVIRNFYPLSPREASAGEYYHENGVTYLSKASAKQSGGGNTLSGW